MKEKRRYRYIEDEFAPKGKRRVLVVMFRGFEGHEVRWTDDCSGCTEWMDGQKYGGGGCMDGQKYGGGGCEECGYTGKRRRREWIPFDFAAYEAHRSKFWKRVERFRRYCRSLQRAAA